MSVVPINVSEDIYSLSNIELFVSLCKKNPFWVLQDIKIKPVPCIVVSCSTLLQLVKMWRLLHHTSPLIVLFLSQAFDTEECMTWIDRGEATVMALDAGEVHIAGRFHSLVPILQEVITLETMFTASTKLPKLIVMQWHRNCSLQICRWKLSQTEPDKKRRLWQCPPWKSPYIFILCLILAHVRYVSARL